MFEMELLMALQGEHTERKKRNVFLMKITVATMNSIGLR